MKKYIICLINRKIVYLTLLLLLHCCTLSAQELQSNSFTNGGFSIEKFEENLRNYNQFIISEKNLVWGWSLGATIELGNQSRGTFRIFTAVSIIQNFSNDNSEIKVFGSLQSELELFRGGLGSSLVSPKNADFNLEWRNTPQLTLGYLTKPEQVWGRPLMPSLGQSFSTLYDPTDISLSLGTTLINGINHTRNQQVGLIRLGILPFHFHYYNDGPFLDFLFLADGYDRYWTGSGAIGLYYAKYAMTSVELRYDRYTGYQPLLYEMSNLLGIDYLSYSDLEQQHYNIGRFQYRFGFYGNMDFMYSVYQPRITDIQEIIHWGVSAFHSNSTTRHHTFGSDFIYRNIFFK